MAIVVALWRTAARAFSPVFASSTGAACALVMNSVAAAVAGGGSAARPRSPIASVTLRRSNFGHIFLKRPFEG